MLKRMLNIRVETRKFCRRSEKRYDLSNAKVGDWLELVEVTDTISIMKSLELLRLRAR